MDTNYCNLSYCTAREAEKVGVKLTFMRKELLYDIKNYAYIEGEVMGEDRQHAQHTLVDVGEAGNADRVTRLLNVVYASVAEMLYPYTKQEAIEEEVDDRLTEPENYVIEMEIPKTFSKTTVTLLSRLIHEYMVYRVLHDWLSITNPRAAENWLNKSREAEEGINTIKNHRSNVFLRRFATPF